MLRLFLIFISLSCKTDCYSQFSYYPESRKSIITKTIDSMVTTLRSKGIDTIIQLTTILGISEDRAYWIYERSHLLWVDNSKAYLRKFETHFDTIFIRDRYEFTNKEVFDFLQKNYEDLVWQEILPCVVKIKDNNIKFYYPSSSTREAGIIIKVYEKNTYWEKSITNSSLEKSGGYFGPNLNYLYNKSTKLAMFRELLLKLIK